MLSPEQIAQMRADAGIPPEGLKAVSSGASVDAESRIAELSGTPNPTSTATPLVKRIGTDLSNRGQAVIDKVGQTKKDVANAGGGLFAHILGAGQMLGDVAGQVAEGAIDIAKETGKNALDVVAPGGYEGVKERAKQQTEDAMSKTNVFGQTNEETLKKVHETVSPMIESLPDNVKGQFGNLFETLGLTGGGKLLNPELATFGTVAKDTLSTAKNIVTKPAKSIGETTKRFTDSVKTENLDPRLSESASRVRDQTPPGGVGAAIRPKLSQRYKEYFKQSENATRDIKQDPAISIVGSNVGDEFKKVVQIRRQAGQVIADELKRVGGTKVSVDDALGKFEADLSENGLSRGKDGLVGGDLSKVNEADRQLLDTYGKEVGKLGSNPSVAQIDAMISRVSGDLDLYKSRNGITGTTNGERIIKKSLNDLRSSIDADKAKNPELAKYSAAKAAYSDLSDFVNEGSKYLGKVTQSGDFAKDASLTKSAVQSILNNGKKDWLMRLEEITGYPALDESVIALQAMKDAGDYRGLSLLQTLAGKGGAELPMSKDGITARILDYTMKKGGELFYGKPNDRTLKFLEELEKEGKKPKK